MKRKNENFEDLVIKTLQKNLTGLKKIRKTQCSTNKFTFDQRMYVFNIRNMTNHLLEYIDFESKKLRNSKNMNKQR